jgi:hypothetical protein
MQRFSLDGWSTQLLGAPFNRFLRLSGVCRMQASPKICPDLETRGRDVPRF